mgnify:FL=1
MPTVQQVLKKTIEKNTQRGMAGKPLRLMVVGIPNTGKSSFINRMAGKNRAKVADKAGVTRQNQWFAVGGGIELLDTPGVLWPKFDDPEVGDRLAFIGSVKDEVTDLETLTCRLLEVLGRTRPQAIIQRYGIEVDEYMQGFQERNPTLRVFGAFLHMDEATPHLHIDFVPYVSGWKGKGLDTKVSLKQALKALGFVGGSKRESELNQWINAEKEQLAAVMERHGIEWEQKGTHEEHLSVLDFKKQERSKEVAALEAAKQECQTDLIEMQEQLETAQTAVDAAEQRMQKVEQTYQKQSQKLNKLAPIMEGLENLSAQYSQRPEEWVPEAATFETAKSYREKKAMPLIQKLVKVLFALHRKYWEVKNERDKYQYFYQDEKKATRHLSQQLEQVKAENSQLYAMKRDFRRVWNYFGAEKMQQVIGFMREQEQTTDRSQKKNRQNNVEL